MDGIGRWTMDDERWQLANSMILYCLPGKDWALWISYPGLCPGLLPLRLWRLPDALFHDGGWQTDVAAGDVIGPSRR